MLATSLTVLSGGERFSHLSWWGHGIEAIKKGFAVEWLPRASSTLTRFWGKIYTQSLSENLVVAARQLPITIIGWQGIGKDNLKLDSSVLIRYGNQQRAKRGYNSKKRGRPSHHPLLAFLGSGYVVNVWNRSGDSGTGQSALSFFIKHVWCLEPISTSTVSCVIVGFMRLTLSNTWNRKASATSLQ